MHWIVTHPVDSVIHLLNNLEPEVSASSHSLRFQKHVTERMKTIKSVGNLKRKERGVTEDFRLIFEDVYTSVDGARWYKLDGFYLRQVRLLSAY